MSVDFEREVTHIAAQIVPPYQLAPETIPIAVQSLEEIDQKYGPESANPLDFHNAPHSLGSIRRGVRLTNIFHQYIRPVHRSRIFDLAIIGEATHDLEQLLGSRRNEAASTVGAIALIEAEDGVLNTQTFKKRLGYAHSATVVDIQEDGTVVQVNLRTGARDPIKLIGGYGDINGIGMEGDTRMWEDGTNLYFEMTARAGKEPTISGLYHFLTGQASFIHHRYNDEQVKADIGYYFPDNMDEIYRNGRKLFHGRIISAFRLAVMLGEHPELQSSIGHIVSAVDRPFVGPMIGKMIRRKAAQA